MFNGINPCIPLLKACLFHNKNGLPFEQRNVHWTWELVQALVESFDPGTALPHRHLCLVEKPWAKEVTWQQTLRWFNLMSPWPAMANMYENNARDWTLFSWLEPPKSSTALPTKLINLAIGVWDAHTISYVWTVGGDLHFRASLMSRFGGKSSLKWDENRKHLWVKANCWMSGVFPYPCLSQLLEAYSSKRLDCTHQI